MIACAFCICRLTSGVVGERRKLPSAPSVTHTASPSPAFIWASASLGRTTPTELPILRSFNSRIIRHSKRKRYNAQGAVSRTGKLHAIRPGDGATGFRDDLSCLTAHFMQFFTCMRSSKFILGLFLALLVCGLAPAQQPVLNLDRSLA